MDNIDQTLNAACGDVNKDESEQEDSDTESFVDALENLATQCEKPIEHSDTETRKHSGKCHDGQIDLENTAGNGANYGQSSSNTAGNGANYGQPSSNTAGNGANYGQPSSNTAGNGANYGQPSSNTAGNGANYEQSSSNTAGNGANYGQSSSNTEEKTNSDVIEEMIKSATTETDDEEDELKSSIEDEDEEDEVLDEEEMKRQEENMTEEEKQKRKDEAQGKKAEGNERFKLENYPGALEMYTDALMICPLCYSKERSIMYSNRAACKYKLERHDVAIEDCTKALELNPLYLKALLRRAELYEKKDKLDESLADYTKALEMDDTLLQARHAVQTFPARINERNEKMKEEMMGKLKDLGNMILKPFGLSTNNFNLQQDANTGSYSVQFQQGQPGQTQPPQPTQSNGK